MVSPAKMPPEVVARAQVLRDEGMPLPWISEEVGYSTAAVRRYTTAPADAEREWKTAWSQIVRSEVLTKLHQELAPRNWS